MNTAIELNGIEYEINSVHVERPLKEYPEMVPCTINGIVAAIEVEPMANGVTYGKLSDGSPFSCILGKPNPPKTC